MDLLVSLRSGTACDALTFVAPGLLAMETAKKTSFITTDNAASSSSRTLSDFRSIACTTKYSAREAAAVECVSAGGNFSSHTQQQQQVTTMTACPVLFTVSPSNPRQVSLLTLQQDDKDKAAVDNLLDVATPSDITAVSASHNLLMLRLVDGQVLVYRLHSGALDASHSLKKLNGSATSITAHLFGQKEADGEASWLMAASRAASGVQEVVVCGIHPTAEKACVLIFDVSSTMVAARGAPLIVSTAQRRDSTTEKNEDDPSANHVAAWNVNWSRRTVDVVFSASPKEVCSIPLSLTTAAAASAKPTFRSVESNNAATALPSPVQSVLDIGVCQGMVWCLASLVGDNHVVVMPLDCSSTEQVHVLPVSSAATCKLACDEASDVVVVFTGKALHRLKVKGSTTTSTKQSTATTSLMPAEACGGPSAEDILIGALASRGTLKAVASPPSTNGVASGVAEAWVTFFCTAASTSSSSSSIKATASSSSPRPPQAVLRDIDFVLQTSSSAGGSGAGKHAIIDGILAHYDSIAVTNAAPLSSQESTTKGGQSAAKKKRAAGGATPPPTTSTSATTTDDNNNAFDCEVALIRYLAHCHGVTASSLVRAYCGLQKRNGGVGSGCSSSFLLAVWDAVSRKLDQCSCDRLVKEHVPAVKQLHQQNALSESVVRDLFHSAYEAAVIVLATGDARRGIPLAAALMDSLIIQFSAVLIKDDRAHREWREAATCFSRFSEWALEWVAPTLGQITAHCGATFTATKEAQLIENVARRIVTSTEADIKVRSIVVEAPSTSRKNKRQ